MTTNDNCKLNGSTSIPNAVAFSPALSATEVRVYLALASHAWKLKGQPRKDTVWPAIATIAELAGVHRATVQRALRRLCELGLVEVSEGGGRHQTNRYRLTDLVGETLRNGSTHATLSTERAAEYAETVAWVHKKVAPMLPQSDKETDEEEDGAGGAATASSSSSEPERLLDEAKDLDEEGLCAFLVEHVKDLGRLAPYKDKLDPETDHRWYVACQAALLHEGVQRFEQLAGRKVNAAELVLLADTMFSMSYNDDKFVAAVDEAATTWERPSVKYVAAIARRMADIEWDPVGRCKALAGLHPRA